MNHKALLCAILGLPADASDDDIQGKAKTFSSTIDNLTGVAGKLTALSSVPEDVKRLGEKLGDLEKRDQERERQAIIETATAQGKAIPQTALEGDAALSNTQLKALCASLPVTVPLERRTVALSAGSTGVEQDSSTELQVFSALGLSKERVEKFAGK